MAHMLGPTGQIARVRDVTTSRSRPVVSHLIPNGGWLRSELGRVWEAKQQMTGLRSEVTVET